MYAYLMFIYVNKDSSVQHLQHLQTIYKQESRSGFLRNGTLHLPYGSLKRQRPTLPPWQYHRRGRA